MVGPRRMASLPFSQLHSNTVKRPMKKVIIGIAIVLLVVAGLGGIKMLQFKALMAAAKSFSQPPETVASGRA